MLAVATEPSCMPSLSDVRLGWAHLLNGAVTRTKAKGGEHFPAFTALIQGVLTPAFQCKMSVVIDLPDEKTLFEIRQWLEDNCKRKYRIFGRFEWTDYGVKVQRDVKGLRFQFDDEDLAFFFKMAWYSRA